MTVFLLCVLLSWVCMSLHVPSLLTHTHTSAPYSPSWGTTLVTVDINTLLCHWVCSAQEWKYLTGTIYRPCRRTSGIHGNTIQPFLELCSTEIASVKRSNRAQRLGSQLGHGGEGVFMWNANGNYGRGTLFAKCTDERDTHVAVKAKTHAIFMQVCTPACLCVLLVWLLRHTYRTRVRIFTTRWNLGGTLGVFDRSLYLDLTLR